MADGVTVGYSGVHQAYQLALAAQEAGVLDAFHCSLFDAQGKWGGKLARVFGSDALVNRRMDDLPVKKVTEHPWPLLHQHLRGKWNPSRVNDWLWANDVFDRHVARALARSPSRVFVGTETCAQHSFAICAALGTMRILDCPQLHPTFLSQVLTEAAARVGIASCGPVDASAMAERKTAEYAAAELLLLYSEVHRRSFRLAGFAEERLFECPLWVDPALWFPDPLNSPRTQRKLQVLFVGGISLRKGVPFLLEAAREFGEAIQLTLVGRVHSELQLLLTAHTGRFELHPPQTKAALRNTYTRHDVLVLPSLGDSFGFVGLEAMACGLPVIVTENCGVPVPDAAWRVPVMNADAITARFDHYATKPEALAADRAVAVAFAREFSPQRYRRTMGELFQRLLAVARN